MNSTNGITADTSTEMGDNPNSFAAPVKRLFLEHGQEMLSLFGESLETTADKLELTAPSSATKAHIAAASLCDRLTQSLISAGLVKGTIPMSMRDGSGQQTLDIVLRSQDGANVDEPSTMAL